MKFPDENVGLLAPSNRSYVPKLEGQIELDEIEATFEQLPYLLTCGILKCESGTADGGGTGKIYEFIAATTAEADISTMTIKGGDDAGFEEMAYCYAEKITISGKAGEAVMMSATMKGRQVAPTTVTAGLTLDAVEENPGGHGQGLHRRGDRDDRDDAEEQHVAGVQAGDRDRLGGEVHGRGLFVFSYAEQDGPKASLELVFEHETIAVAQKVAWRAETRSEIRLIFTGSALTTGGTYTLKTLIIDIAGMWEKFGKIDEADGNDVITGTFRGANDSDAALFLEIVVVNQVAFVVGYRLLVVLPARQAKDEELITKN